MEWEYKIIQIDDISRISQNPEYMTKEDMLNYYGEQGWELVSVENSVAYFKKHK